MNNHYYVTMLKTKEQLLYYFNGKNIKLSTYDEKFCQNLQYLITKNNHVTTNQKNLFEKLISKYKKQITRAGIDVELCKQLPWTTNIVPSEEKYTGAQVSINGDNLALRVPFNKKFIDTFRSTIDNTFEWDKKNKIYTSPFSTTALKLLVDILPKHFTHITYDKDIKKLITHADKFNAPIWSPTLVCVNGYYIVAAINNSLNISLENIKLNDDYDTLFKLSQLGIDVDKSITKNNQKKIFASSPVAHVEINNLLLALTWLKELKIEKVYYGKMLSFNISITLSELMQKINPNDNLTTIKNTLKKLNIKNADSSKFFSDINEGPVAFIQTLSTINGLHYHKGNKISKYIILQDSNPVNIQ